ncbi:unnamed protein product, partial [Effrenium voratum]
VIIPTFSVLNGLRPGRRRMPAQALWRSGLLNPRPRCPESLETLEVDVKDEKVQGVMEELSPKRRGSVQWGVAAQKQKSDPPVRRAFAFGMRLRVAQCSGQLWDLELPSGSRGRDLAARARRFLPHLAALVSPQGQVLQEDTVLESCLQEGDTVTAVARQGTLVSRPWAKAFAYLRPDGTVATWGEPDAGGDSSQVQAQLSSVQRVAVSCGAFAALRAGGVVTWGKPEAGGDSQRVQDSLFRVEQICASLGAFCALRSDGHVVTWGNPACGGESSAVQHQLTNVRFISASFGAFAAATENGIVCWGQKRTGGDGRLVQHVHDVQSIFATTAAFCALRSNGQVVAWGHQALGGSCAAVQHRFGAEVVQVAASGSAFAALLGNGEVVAWGDSTQLPATELKDVSRLFANDRAFAAIKADGTVETWGCSQRGGSGETRELRAVDIQATANAFAALRSDGTCVTWGDAQSGDPSELKDLLQLCGSCDTFAALRADGRVVTWGQGITRVLDVDDRSLRDQWLV